MFILRQTYVKMAVLLHKQAKVPFILIIAVCIFFQTEEDFKFSIKNFFKFMLVRHPLERLLSTYSDKVIDRNLTVSTGYGRYIFNIAERERKKRQEQVNTGKDD